VLTTGDAPSAPEPPEPSRDVPAESIRGRCARLADLERGPYRPEIRAGIELPMDTVRFSSGGYALFSWRAWQQFGVRGCGR
jgi:hypothetical protein